MLNIFCALARALLTAFRSRRDLVFETLALRQQLGVLQRSVRRPRLRNADRAFWVLMSRWWGRWSASLLIVKPATVIRGHRAGFRRYWRWKSRRRAGRPHVDAEIRALIRRMARTNLWGAPRIHGELRKLGVDVSEATVSKYMPRRRRKPPSQAWRAFLDNHLRDLVSVDFFAVPTATFRVLFVFVVLAHRRRRIVHFNVTSNPSAAWTAQQITNAFPWDTAPRYLLRDRDAIYGGEFCRRVKTMGIQEVRIAARSPWQSPYVERVIGTLRRELLDHVIVLGERHLCRLLRRYVDEYYHRCRTHLSLGKDAPMGREVELPEIGEVIELPVVGGLHHRYTRRAA